MIASSKSCYNRLDGPYVRKIKGNNLGLRNNWHTDSCDSITIIIPLTEFTGDNGCTQLLLPLSNYKEGLSHVPVPGSNINISNNNKCKVVNFVGSQPLIMNGEVVQRQSTNTTNKDRDDLLFKIVILYIITIFNFDEHIPTIIPNLII